MDITITKQDGNFIDLTQDSNFVDYDPSTIANGKAVKVRDEGYFSSPFTTYFESTGNGSINIWDASKSSWSYSNPNASNHSFDYYGYNVIIRSSDIQHRVYFCKDDEMVNLPAYDGAYVRVRLNSHIKGTVADFADYRTITSTNHSGLLIPMAIMATGTPDTFSLIGLIKDSNNDISLSYWSGSKSYFSYATPNNPLASMARYIVYKDTAIEDLEQRVYELEQEVAALSAVVSEHSKLLKDLPAVVSAVSSNVSKLYVAR